ncbi:MAG: Holliday junction DNA helicase RuvA [Gammaproteobacteria bacterium RIFCSPHIGHO2_12_FULL_37_14]|nr:MAG: Holliday junction DNA helicase RuvA [Gammaproteobacteria bacterium RIFCSPHIGHO2_12_FULL_37_14]
MIGQIRGIILEKQPPSLLVEVSGIGYEIDAPMSTFYQLPDIGQTVTLLTHFVVREDAQHLYGFYTSDERLLFRTLLKVNGVGPRLALTVLSSTATDQFVRCVLNNDTDSLVKLPGVGKKTAERLVIEMRDKLADWYTASSSTSTNSTRSVGDKRHQILQDAISALVTLGYKQHDANRTVTKIDDGAASSEELIRRALREMV